MNTDIISYYKQRAHEYEQLYLRPERQKELAKASEILKSTFVQKKVLEIACGTGYWTRIIAETATEILATDINQEVLDIAAQKDYPNANVAFALADFNNYCSPKRYEGLFGGFIWSHIELQHLDKFIDTVSSFVIPGGTLVFMDNKYVEGSSTAIAETDEHGNTFQQRKLSDGSLHRVLKNFPQEDFIRGKLGGRATNIQFIDMDYYWILQFKSAL